VYIVNYVVIIPKYGGRDNLNMKKIAVFLVVAICAAFIVTGAKAYTISYTLYVAQGTYETTESMYTDTTAKYAVVNYMDVEGGDTFDMYLQARDGGNVFRDISPKATVTAALASDTLIAYKGSSASTPSGYDSVIKCNASNASTASNCIVSGNTYRMRFENGSWFGGTVAIVGLFYASNYLLID
jgi:hypothetical protein